MDEDKDLQGQLIADEETKVVSTEAPMSGTIKGYYKGYSLQMTARDPKVKIGPLLKKMIEMVDYMDEHGFQPSWNMETNIKAKNGQAEAKPSQEDCNHANITVRVVKKEGPNQGRSFRVCVDCGKFIGWA